MQILLLIRALCIRTAVGSILGTAIGALLGSTIWCAIVLLELPMNQSGWQSITIAIMGIIIGLAFTALAIHTDMILVSNAQHHLRWILAGAFFTMVMGVFIQHFLYPVSEGVETTQSIETTMAIIGFGGGERAEVWIATVWGAVTGICTLLTSIVFGAVLGAISAIHAANGTRPSEEDATRAVQYDNFFAKRKF